MNNEIEEAKTMKNQPGRERSRALFIAMVVSGVLVIGSGAGVMFGPSLPASQKPENAAPAAMPPLPVETTEVRVSGSDRMISAVGTLLSEESVVVASEIAGRIETIGFAEGERTERARVLIQLDAAMLRAQLDRAEAALALSKTNYHRAESLLKEHAISEKERDEAYARRQLDEADLRLAAAQLEKTEIRAPFAGTLGLRRVSRGDYVQPGQPLINIEAIDRLKVEFRVPEKSLNEVKAGQKITLQSEAHAGRDFAGRVYAVNPQVEEQSRSLVVRALVENRDRALLPGQFVQVQLGVAHRTEALFIPEQALISQPKTQLVYRVVEGKAEMVPVETGARVKGWIEITKGLSPGDQVVTGGHQKIGPGSPVQALPADPALFAKLP